MPNVTLNSVRFNERIGFYWITDPVQSVPAYIFGVLYQIGYWDGSSFLPYASIQPTTITVEAIDSSVSHASQYSALLSAINQQMAPTSSATLALVSGNAGEQGSIYLSS